jgi:hypothetical protein
VARCLTLLPQSLLTRRPPESGLGGRATRNFSEVGRICVLLGALGLGCNKSPPPPQSESRSALVPAPAPSSDAATPRIAHKWLAEDAIECRAPDAARVIAIGDLHGDLKAARRALHLAGAIDENDRWVGGKLVVVQTGDVLDRGDDDRAVSALLEKEQTAAQKAGGALYRLNGNHEVMNVQGDFRYVSQNGFKAYANEPRTGRPEIAELPEEKRGRAEAFLPGGREARKLATLPAVWLVGDTLFAHGGVELKHIHYGIDRLNRELGAWMRGAASLPKHLANEHTPFWTRTYGESPASEEVCAVLDEVLSSLKAARLVIGHTPQKSGITFDCNRKLARIDVGLSAYYGNNPTEVLEIVGGAMRILK